MLVLSRDIGQMIKIGDDIEIRILGIERGQIRIGIEAPRSVTVVRSELLDRPRKTEAPEIAASTTGNHQPTVRILRRRSHLIR